MPETKKPNILILWGDDIGWWNISYNSRGQMGYRTPNIDRIANEGVATAGRAAFITGQSDRHRPHQSRHAGGRPWPQRRRSDGRRASQPLGYATGQFGKNHLGDKDQFLPTVHRFNEFFGNLYHLNAEEEPVYPKDPEFKKHFGPRGVLHCKSDGKGGQTIEDTGSADQEAYGDHRRRSDGAHAQVHRRDAQVRQAVPPLYNTPQQFSPSALAGVDTAVAAVSALRLL